MTCLVLVYLLCCCGACLRRSLHCHTCAFIHLERFDGLSSARKSSRRLRRSALGSTSQERPYLYASVMPAARLAILRPVLHPSLLRQLGRPGKGLTLTLRLVRHPRVFRHLGTPNKGPQGRCPHPLCYGNWAGPERESLTPTNPVQTHLGRFSKGFDNSRRSQCKHTWDDDPSGMTVQES